jgi:hypothetical protein
MANGEIMDANQGPEHAKLESFWQYVYGGVAKVNTILYALSQMNPAQPDCPDRIENNRAFYYYQALTLGECSPSGHNHKYTGRIATDQKRSV